MRFPIKNPLAGLILRMFNLPTGTILINVWIKVGRLRLYYLHQPSLLSLHQTGSDSTQPLPDHHNHHRKSTCRYDACPLPMYLRTEHKLFCIRLLNPTDKLRTAGFCRRSPGNIASHYRPIASTWGMSHISGCSSRRYQIQAVSTSVADLLQKSGFFMLSFVKLATIETAYSRA